MIFRWRVRVGNEHYGRVGVVFVTRRPFSRFHHSGIRVATINLQADDAEEQLAAARAKAHSYVRGLRQIESVSL